MGTAGVAAVMDEKDVDGLFVDAARLLGAGSQPTGYSTNGDLRNITRHLVLAVPQQHGKAEKKAKRHQTDLVRSREPVIFMSLLNTFEVLVGELQKLFQALVSPSLVHSRAE
jgi:hypothetical protein